MAEGKGIFGTLRALIFELSVVFIGMFLALWVNDYQVKVGEDLKRQQIYLAISQEVQSVAAKVDKVYPQVDAFLGDFEKRFKAGERPIPKPVNINLVFEGYAWDYLVQSGGMDLLDIDKLVKFSQLRSQIDLLANEVEKLEQNITFLLLPNMDKGKKEFYKSNSNSLKESYYWYVTSLTLIEKYLKGLKESSRDVLMGFDVE